MKRMLALILCLALCLSLIPAAFAGEIEIVGEPEDEPQDGVPIDEKHFPDDNFRALVSDLFDNGDDVLSDAEIAAATELEFNALEVASIRGVEYLTELTRLETTNMWGDETPLLTEVDLSGNTKLKILTLGFTEIESLDVTMLPELESLMVGYTKLSELDLSGNPELQSLWIDDCRFSDIDLSHNPKLALLDACGNDGLYSLDISANPALVEVYQAGGRHLEWMKEISEELYESVIVYGGTGDHDYTLAVNNYTAVFDEEGVDITVWVSYSIVEHTRERIRAFNESRELDKPINARIEPVGEGEVYDHLMPDPSAAADLFGFPQDQLVNFANAGALDPLDSETAQMVSAENDAGAVQAATFNDQLVAYPMTSDNGYFMYYDKSVIPEEDLGSLEAIIADCEAAGKSFCFEAGSGWYLVSFFFATGGVSEWTLVNNETWWFNDTFNYDDVGLPAAKGLKKLTDSEAFEDCSDGWAAFEELNAAVVVSGVWDYYTLLDILGEDLGAAELPSFTVDGTSYHMSSFSGCKLLGVKPQEDEERAAVLHELAQYLTDEEAQLERFEAAAWGPSNLAAQADPAVQAQPALAALLRQNAYAKPQGVIPGFWWGIATDLSCALRRAQNDETLQLCLNQYERLMNDSVNPSCLAFGYCGDLLIWELNSSGGILISGEGGMWDYGENDPAPWYAYRDSVFELHTSAANIGAYAFYNCTELYDLYLPNERLASLGESAFGNCSALTRFYPGESLVEIGDRCFEGCTGLESVGLPESLASIGEEAFAGCTALTEIRFGGSAPTIGEDCFAGVTATAWYPADDASWTEDVRQDYGGTITWKGVVASGECGYCLNWLLDGEGRLTISGEGDMWDFESYETPWEAYKDDIQAVVLEDGVTSIGNAAFLECYSLTEVTIPDGVTAIGVSAFDGCEALQAVTIPESVTSIGNYAFRACKSLQSVTVSENLVNIGMAAFYYCSSLTEIVVDENNPLYCSVDGVLFDKNRTILFQYPAGKEGAYEIPDSVTAVYAYAFGECEKLTGVTIPESVTMIGEFAFYRSGLTEITIPDSVTSIGQSAFYFCEDLKTAVIGDGLTLLNGSIFASSGLETVTIGGSVNRIGLYAFNRCADLKTVYLPNSVTEIGAYAFEECSALKDVYYDGYEEALAHYKGNEWSTSQNSYFFNADWHFSKTPEEGWHLCGNDLFWQFDADTGTMTVKGSGAMWDFFFRLDDSRPWKELCSDLRAVIVGPGATYIGKAAFRDCSALESVDLPDDLKVIGQSAFENCGGLTSVTLPDGVITIQKSAFEYCRNLTSVTLPDSLNSIGYYAFENCGSLTSVTIPAGVTDIGGYAFGFCYALQEIRFKGFAPWLYNDCFYNVTATAYYPANDPSWTEDVMQDYGGTITWVSYSDAPDLVKITDDRTGNLAAATYVETLDSGEVVFSVASEGDKAVLVVLKNGDTYTRLECTTDENGVHSYTAELGEGTEIVLVLKGDVNLDGVIKATDGTMLKRGILGSYTFKSELARMAADLNGDGVLRASEGTQIARSILGTFTIKW